MQQDPRALPMSLEVSRLEEIFGRSVNDPQVRNLLFAAHFRIADAALQSGVFATVDQSLSRMKFLDDQQPQIHELETYLRVRQNDWAGAVLAARRHEAVAGEKLPISVTLAGSLHNLGQVPDALSVLNRPIFESCTSASAANDVAACESAKNLRTMIAAAMTPRGEVERPRAALSVDPAKQQIQSDRFDIRFDGENQSGVARDVLFVLDRAYVRLADIYYERPTRKIPVVLHSQSDYYNATGAPFWSGGQYSSHSGAIQIPIRGLPSALPREMEDVLVHELSHAFVDEMSGGRAGRDLQEGLAQYMEGKRIESELSLAELKRLAHSGGGSVMNFYHLSLAVSQQLVQSRGQGMVNQLLRAIKETRSEDGGFQKVFGQTGAAMRTDILTTFWRRYS